MKAADTQKRLLQGFKKVDAESSVAVTTHRVERTYQELQNLNVFLLNGIRFIITGLRLQAFWPRLPSNIVRDGEKQNYGLLCCSESRV